MHTQLSERQLEIIEASSKILTSSGVSGLTIKNLASEMKFTESALYRHFKSKEEIIVCMLNYLKETLSEYLQEGIKREDQADVKFEKVFRNKLNFFTKNPHFTVAVFSDGLMESSQDINQAIFNLMANKRKLLYGIIEEGQQQQIFTSELSTEHLLHISMGTFRLHMFKWRISNFSFDMLSSGEQLIQSILKLIKTK